MGELGQLAGQAPVGEFWFATGLGAVLGLAALWSAFVFLNRKRVIENHPTALIRSAPQGYVELQGRAQFMDGDEIFAELSMRHAVWYRYKIEQQKTGTNSGTRSKSWVTIDQGVSDDMFYLDDATGRCAIDPDGASVTPTHMHVWYGSSRIPGRYHESDGVWWARFIGSMSRAYRYTESRIEPGDELYVLGNFQTHGGGATRFDKAGTTGDLLREWKRDQQFMLNNFDTNNDGEIDLDEWEAARNEAALEVEKRNSGGGPPPVDVLGQTGNRRQPFVIHSGSEDEIVKRCQRSAIGLFALGLPLSVGSLWVMGLRLVGG